MNENFIELQDKKVNLDLFYCVTLWRDTEIQLQGKMSMELISYCKEMFNITEFKTNDNNLLKAESGKFKITLT